MKYILTTDGSCQPNPGFGGWAFHIDPKGIYVYGSSSVSTISGWNPEYETTNNRMEAAAIILGLNHLEGNREIEVRSDSTLMVNGINQWMRGWRQRGWRRATGRLENADLWMAMQEAINRHADVRAVWVPRNSTPQHNGCDVLAKEMASYGKPAIYQDTEANLWGRI